jgi:hypothetical protein
MPWLRCNDRCKHHVAMMGLAGGNEMKREPEMAGNPISFVLFFSSPSVNHGIFTEDDDQNRPEILKITINREFPKSVVCIVPNSWTLSPHQQHLCRGPSVARLAGSLWSERPVLGSILRIDQVPYRIFSLRGLKKTTPLPPLRGNGSLLFRRRVL